MEFSTFFEGHILMVGWVENNRLKKVADSESRTIDVGVVNNMRGGDRRNTAKRKMALSFSEKKKEQKQQLDLT
jgi:hypothetical protein